MRAKNNGAGAVGAILLAGVVTIGCSGCCGEPPAEFGEMTTLAGTLTDKGAAGHEFTEIYEHLLFPLRYEPIRILEIGISSGGSLVLWQEYFPNAQVFGIDIEDKSKFENERVSTFVADQASREQLQAFVDRHGTGFDVILDDGGHSMEQQQVSLGFLLPHVKPGGYYILEDVHTSLTGPGGGFGVEEGEGNTTLTMIETFLRTSTVRSEYLTAEEEAYLTEHVEYSNLFHRKTQVHSMTCIFRKKTSATTHRILLEKKR